MYKRQSHSTDSISGHSIQSLAATHSGGYFDVIKLDIEGAEAEVFKTVEDISRLMKICRLLVLEIHDEVFDRLWFCRSIGELGLTQMSDGELTYIWNSRDAIEIEGASNV